MTELDSSQNGDVNWINFLPKRQSSKKSFKFHKSKNSNLAQDDNKKMLKGHHSESSTFHLFSKTQTAFLIFHGSVSSTFLDISWLITNCCKYLSILWHFKSHVMYSFASEETMSAF